MVLCVSGRVKSVRGWCLPCSQWGWVVVGGTVTWQFLLARQRLPCLLVYFGGSRGAGGVLAVAAAGQRREGAAMHVDTECSDMAVIVTRASGFFISDQYLVVTEGYLLGLHDWSHGVMVVGMIAGWVGRCVTDSTNVT